MAKITSDLSYYNLGLFTLILPNTADGEIAWKTIANNTDSTGKIFTVHLEFTLKQIRAAGYTVSKAAKPEKTFDEILLTDLFN